MQFSHTDLPVSCNRLFHVSENPGIKLFEPRPSPSFFEEITGDVVFAISGDLLHNYILPRDCPRVTYYAGEKTTESDKEKFIAPSAARYIVTVESGWYQRIKGTKLYCYEFLNENFMLADECAGYYVSHQPVVPLSVIRIDDALAELLTGDVEIRFTPSLIQLAAEVRKSSLNFSVIRMRNALLK